MADSSLDHARNTVIAFLEGVARGDVDDAFARHASDDFRHHNPWFAQDRESLREAMKTSATAEPGKRFEVQQAIAEGDRVMVFSRLTRPQGQVHAVVHIARMSEGRIAEMWDIGQEVPADSPNVLGMF